MLFTVWYVHTMFMDGKMSKKKKAFGCTSYNINVFRMIILGKENVLFMKYVIISVILINWNTN